MQIFHELEEGLKHFKIRRYHKKHAHNLRSSYDSQKIGDFTLRVGTVDDLPSIKKLHELVFNQYLWDWLYQIFLDNPKDLVTVLVDKDNNILAYDLYFFQEMEWGEDILHELYIGVVPFLQNQGIAKTLRKYSTDSYEQSGLKGLSTLAPFDNKAALRTAQRVGYAITKACAKPPSHYLYKNLKPKA